MEMHENNSMIAYTKNATAIFKPKVFYVSFFLNRWEIGINLLMQKQLDKQKNNCFNTNNIKILRRNI